MNIQSKCDVLGKYGCLLFSYLAAVGLEEELAIVHFERLVQAGIIDEECTVLDADFLYEYFRVNASVRKEDDVSKAPARDVYVAKWQYVDNEGKKHSHFVVMQAGKIIYNSLDNSQTIQKGRIISLRLIERKYL